MQKPTNLKKGEKFRVMKGNSYFNVGEIISLKRDDGTENPYFWNEDWSEYHCIYFSRIEPYAKTVRYAQVGDVVVGKSSGDQRMVLERGQNTVVLSNINSFKMGGSFYTFHDLERCYTLKAAPEGEETLLTMDQIAEKFGVDVSTLKIAKE